MKKQSRQGGRTAAAVLDGEELLSALVSGAAAAPSSESIAGVIVGELVAMTDNARTPLVLFPGQRGTGAVEAQSVVDLHGAHLGRRVVLMFEGGDRSRPIVLGVLREGSGWPLEEKPGAVAVDADGERMLVSAREQLVLRCGKASITLTKAGKVLIEGAYVSSRSSGVNRVKGGSVQLN
jgi:hypothetical protein